MAKKYILVLYKGYRIKMYNKIVKFMYIFPEFLLISYYYNYPGVVKKPHYIIGGSSRDSCYTFSL